MYTLQEFKTVFDPILKEFLDKRINEFLRNTTDPFVRDFVLYSKTLSLAGGKRIRPYIAYIMYTASGGKNTEAALRLFVCFEIFHMFALMHDDVMDKQDKRHGIATVHAYVLERLKENDRTGDLENVAKAQGILAGSLFFSWAMELFLDDKEFPGKNLKIAHDYFYKMVDEVCLGQIFDIDTTSRKVTPEELVTQKTILKTSRYTFVRPAQIGAHLADPNNKLDDYLENLGTKLGIAFQLQDDLLDIIGDTKKLEKNILRDVADRQSTFFTNFVLHKGSKMQREKFLHYFGNELNSGEQEEVINIFTESGAIDAGKKLILQNLEEAKRLINMADLGNDYKKTCLDLIQIMQDRQN